MSLFFRLCTYFFKDFFQALEKYEETCGYFCLASSIIPEKQRKKCIHFRPQVVCYIRTVQASDVNTQPVDLFSRREIHYFSSHSYALFLAYYGDVKST